MSQVLPKGYKVVFVRESVKKVKSVSSSPLFQEVLPIHDEFYIGEMYNELFPLDLFTKISDQAVEVYHAGFTAIGSSFRSQ